MAAKSSRRLRTYSLGLICFVSLVAAGCGSVEPSPTGPSPATTPGPSPSPAPAPGPTPTAGPGKLEVTVNPNPVPWSGQAIDGGCAEVANTWFYNQVLKNTGGNTIVVSDRSDFFDNVERSKRSNLGINLAPGAETSIATRWCSSAAGNHSAQTNWGATDTGTGAVLTVNGPRVTLQAK